MAKKNPKVGKHRDLFAREYIAGGGASDPGEVLETDVVTEDWRELSDKELRRAAENGEITEGEYAEIEEEDAALYEELRELDETVVERDAQPFIDYVRGRMWGYLEMEYGSETGEGVSEGNFDYFQSELESLSEEDLLEAAATTLDTDADTLENLEGIDEVLRDPGNFDLKRHDDEYSRVTGAVWQMSCGVVEDQTDGVKYDKELKEVLDRLTPRSLAYALKDLDQHEPYISISAFNYRRMKEETPPDPDKLYDGFTAISSFYESSRIVATYNHENLEAAIAELEPAEVPQVGPEHDDVAYRYSGKNDSVAGASARGMYVARLKPKDLRREGSTQGICIGREENGHPKALREGKTQVFSIRTESGKPKFTIELKKTLPPAVLDGGPVLGIEEDGKWWQVAEVKGKANRKPGFEAGKDAFTKPDDLRLVTDFLLSLGYTPDAIRAVTDVRPGVLAMEETGVSPFEPPPRKVRPPRPTQNPLSRAVRDALAKTRPMGTFK